MKNQVYIRYLTNVFGRCIFRFFIQSVMLSASIAAADSLTLLSTQEINQLVWQKAYGVSDAQINNPAWLAADDDHDGLSNGDELKAGTNPFDSSSTFKNADLTVFDHIMSLTFPTQAGKLYVLQYSTDLSMWAVNTPPIQAIGQGTPLTLTSSAGVGKAIFLRVVVQDVDSDGDGVSDWAERVLGFDPNNKYTNGSAVDDLTAITEQLTNQTLTATVTVRATKATATQPNLNGVATDLATLTFTRSGGSNLGAITVPLKWGGTAIPQVDYYVATPTSITFPANAATVGLVVVPLANTNLKTGVTATVTIPNGNGYLIGGSGTASTVIYPATLPKGTGLTGSYFNGISPTKQIATNVYPYNPALFSGAPSLTRLDSTIDFDWASGSPGAGINNSYFAVNWQGSVQPEYSETYYFDIVSDDGVKLWVNNQLIINGWQTNGGSQTGVERIGSISLNAGVLYDIKLQYYQATGLDLVHLNWYSQSQVKQIIPSPRLYPTNSAFSNAPPTITSSNATTGFLDQPFSFNVMAVSPGAQAVTYSLGNPSGPLPPGLSLDPLSGLISGTPTASGDYQIALSASNSAGTGASVLDIQILPEGSGITRELWLGLANSNILTIPLTTSPKVTDLNLTSLEDLSSYPVNTGERLRGYFTAPATGNYYFWLAASNVAELWISDNSEPVNLLRRASVVAPGTTTQQWNAVSQSSQRSPWLSLIQGNKYYFEVLHNTGSSGTGNNLSVTYLIDPTGSATAPTSNSAVARYLINQYDYPITLTTPGTVYVTNLAPLLGTGSSASGSATLRLNQAQTQALIHFNYGNLSSPQTSYAIYGPDDKGSETILYDINAVDQFRPDLKTADGGYIWNIATSSAISASTALSDILNGNASLEVQTVKNPAGEIAGKFYMLQGSQQAPTYVANPSYVNDSSTDAGAARFLNQAAFGAAPVDLAYVEANGYAAWINNQRSLPATHLTPYFTYLGTLVDYNPTGSALVPNTWWRTAVTAPDQLRQRVAFALSEILVVSAKDDTFYSRGTALTSYYDMLIDNSFGNFRDLLKTVTLHPAMGIYLNMQGNTKGNLATGYHPDENYAREVMQLFSIGLNRLWPDGSLILDSQGNPVPTYTQDTITNGFARVFTGWTWHQALQTNGQLPTNFYIPADYIDPMTMVKGYHELGTKNILDNVVLPPAVGYNSPQSIAGTQADTTTAAYDSYCLGDLDKAIDNLFNNPNVGPLVCRELIQRLVESNPSPAYVYRVTQFFNDNGTSQHTRGDLSAVISAILLDSEARDKSLASSSLTLGKQREPLLRVVSPARTFLAAANSGSYQQTGGPLITITTKQPHRFSPNDTVWLDFTGNATGNPPTEPSIDPTTTAYKVVATPTTNTFTVNTPESAVVACVEPAGSTTLTVTYSPAPSIGAKVYLKFTSNAPLNGIYEIADQPDSQHFTVLTAKPAPSQGLTDTVSIPRAGCVETTSSSASNFTITTDQNVSLKNGDHFWLNTSSPDLKQGEWVVSSVSSLRNYVVTSTSSHQAGTITGSTLYPLTLPPSTRSGVVSLPNGTFSVGSTDSDLSQTPLGSPTVFNYFYPDYKYPGTLAENNISTPEFQLTTDSNILNLTNSIVSAILASGNSSGLSSYKGGSVDFDLLPYMNAYASINTVKTVSGDTVTLTTTSTVDSVGLVNKLGDILTGGMLTPATKTLIVTLLNDPASFPPDVVKGTIEVPPAPPTFPSPSVRDRVRAAVQLILASPEYAIQR